MKKTLCFLFLVLISCATSFAQNQFEVQFKDLPKDVQKYISKNFEGYTIDKAIQGEDKKKNLTFCDVYVSKGTEKVKVTFDSDGDFVKQEVLTAENSTTPAPAPTATPAPAPTAAPAPAPAPTAEPAAPKIN